MNMTNEKESKKSITKEYKIRQHKTKIKTVKIKNYENNRKGIIKERRGRERERRGRKEGRERERERARENFIIILLK